MEIVDFIAVDESVPLRHFTERKLVMIATVVIA
jgi:hypothetical protein